MIDPSRIVNSGKMDEGLGVELKMLVSIMLYEIVDITG